jgi:hypothetical protein
MDHINKIACLYSYFLAKEQQKCGARGGLVIKAHNKNKTFHLHASRQQNSKFILIILSKRTIIKIFIPHINFSFQDYQIQYVVITINTDACYTPLQPLIPAISSKCPQLLTTAVSLLHYNARLHSASATVQIYSVSV